MTRDLANNRVRDLVEKSNVKQWAQAYADAIFVQSFPTYKTEDILSEPEARDLWNQFQTEAQIEVLNKYNGLVRRTIPYCRYINELYIQFVAEFNNVRGYLLLLEEYMHQEHIYNDILALVKSSGPKNHTLYNKILKVILKEEWVFGRMELSDEKDRAVGFNYTQIKKTNEFGPSIRDSMFFARLATSATACAMATERAETAMEAIRIALKEEGVSLKTVKAYLKDVGTRFYHEYTVWQGVYNKRVQEMGVPVSVPMTGKTALIPEYKELFKDPDEIEEIVRAIKGLDHE